MCDVLARNLKEVNINGGKQFYCNFCPLAELLAAPTSSVPKEIEMLSLTETVTISTSKLEGSGIAPCWTAHEFATEYLKARAICWMPKKCTTLMSKSFNSEGL